MFKFLHTADIHLDSPLKGLESYEDAPVEEIREASRRAFDNLIAFAIDEEVDFILIAGDLYDGPWKDYNTGLFFVNRMGRLKNAGIRVFIVAGNHDAASHTTKALPLPDNVTLFSAKKAETKLLDELQVAIQGRSYPASAVSENLASLYPSRHAGYFNIGLLHTALNGREGHEPYAPCSVDDLRATGYDYWALGHVHQQEIVARDPWIIFPGNLQGRHIRETGAKGATLVTVAEGRVTAVEQREFDVLRWVLCRVDLTTCETIDAVFEQVRQRIEAGRAAGEGRPLAMRVILAGACPVHADLIDRWARLIDELRGVAASAGEVWLEKVLLQTRHRTDLAEMVGRDTALAGLLHSLEELQLGTEDLFALVPDLPSFKTRLPHELFEGDEPFLADTPEQMDALRAEVRELLVARLLQHGGRG
ncbi:MAG: DNA repair exonuclease [Proteobacteria bacterium]|nr:DNA repair exonuclease [Pseudomonadota bacterium]MBU4297016.1 DNA repair exonuclease [Pseudomonadota bacterium]MCG2749897.1 DNA repair exonuclease [Desulfobulbaceae bacterium]